MYAKDIVILLFINTFLIIVLSFNRILLLLNLKYYLNRLLIGLTFNYPVLLLR